MSSNQYAAPQRGASLILAFRPRATVIVGSNRLAATRASSALEADSSVIILAKGGSSAACEELKWREQRKELEIIDFDQLAGPPETSRDSEDAAFESFLDRQTPGSVSLVFITDTLISSDTKSRRSQNSATELYNACRRRNIPVNVTDTPVLCDFTVCTTHRFLDNKTGNATPLQVAITTNGQGCRLASRLKREVVAKLTPEAGVAVEKVGQLRRLAKSQLDNVEDMENELNEEVIVSTPNRPVEQHSVAYFEAEESEMQRVRRRMKWVAQISEYWSLSQLAELTDDAMAELLAGELRNPTQPSAYSSTVSSLPSQHSLTLSQPTKAGRVLLVGSGPGHPSLLTLAAHDALTRAADLVLTDKLVPAGVLALIPPHVEVRVARKFPGNAEGAQQELMEFALEGARAGRTVVRLKQGDPALYGRVGEELLFLRSHGVDALIVPGISSALAAPLLAQIPVTQRGAADSLAICTGVGRGGAKGRIPGYERGRTLVLLMGVARLESMVSTLIAGDTSSSVAYPPNVPAAIVERASMPDQRVITAPLIDIVAALESVGEQRPPGLLVVGWAVLSLWGKGDMTVLDEHKDDAEVAVLDKERVERWLEGRRWRVTEGLDPLWNVFKIPGVES